MNATGEQVRAFIAVELSPEVKESLRRLQGRLKPGSRAPVRWVDPESIHLTLKFLGDVSPGLPGRIAGVLEEAVRGVRPFPVELKGLGVFPNPRRVQIVWVGLAGEVEKLGVLQKRIETGLVPLGFAAEGRPFMPHLTLGRVRDQASPSEREDLGRLVTAAPAEIDGKLTVDAVHLIRSQLTPAGPIYTRLNTVQLK